MQSEAHVPGSVAVLTQIASEQHAFTFDAQLPPAATHAGAQNVAGAHTAEEPLVRTLQQPLLHCEASKHVAAHVDLDGLSTAKTHVEPLQQASASFVQSDPAERHEADVAVPLGDGEGEGDPLVVEPSSLEHASSTAASPT